MKINELSDFFDFDSKYLSTTVLASAIGLKRDENGLNEHWNLVKGIYKGINFPVTFKQDEGKNLTDILNTGWPSLHLISDRLKNILESNKLTGWKTFPIILFDKKGNEIPGYHGFSFIGKCGPLSYENSKIIEKRYVPNGPLCKFYKGLSIDKWDGSDFFTPEGTYHTFISKKAADALRENKISNMMLENLSEIETDVDNVRKG